MLYEARSTLDSCSLHPLPKHPIHALSFRIIFSYGAALTHHHAALQELAIIILEGSRQLVGSTFLVLVYIRGLPPAAAAVAAPAAAGPGLVVESTSSISLEGEAV